MKLNAIKSLVAVSSVALGASAAHAQLISGQTSDYAVLVDGSVQEFEMAGNSSVTGDVGIATPNSGNAPQVSLAGGTINGSLQFANTYNEGNQQNNNPPNFGGTITDGYSQNVAEVTTVMNIVSSLSSTLGSFSGAALTIDPSSGGTQTVSATSGTYDSAENAYVFDVSSMTLNSGTTLKITGTASQNVVLNVNDQNGEFDGGITLSGGLTANNVIINILSSGEFQNADGGASQTATFIDEFGQDINIENPINGHFYGGANNGNFQITSGGSVIDVVGAVPEPGTWMAAAFLMLPMAGSALKLIRKRSAPSSLPV